MSGTISTNGLAVSGSTINVMNWPDSTGFYTTPQFVYSTPAGTETKFVIGNDGNGHLSPTLYVKYVKSKIGKIELAKLKARVAKLKKLVVNASDMGQTALYENLSHMLAITIRESEANAYGIDRFVDRKFIDKFRNKVKESPVRFDLLENFPRTIPANVQKKIKEVQGAQLFDNLHVLYLDYTKQDTRTNKDKIRDKDPILFGTYSYQPDRYYFIIDWIDEKCDLTLDKFVDSMKQDDKEFNLGEIPELNEKFFDMLKSEVKDRHERLLNTNSKNFRANMKMEDMLKKGRSLKTWWQKFKKKYFGNT